MLVKGIILSQVNKTVDNNYILTNRYNVRVPVFEAQGSNEKAILECGLVFQPGNNLGYEYGDVVVVGFENNDINSGFILGKLYTNDSTSEHKAEANPFNLTVQNKATLPKDTTINNLNIFNEIVDIKKRLNELTPASSKTSENS